MSPSSQWPPSEGVYPTTVVARLAELGWAAGTYRLVRNTRMVALIAAIDPVFEPYALVNLVTGSVVAEYETESWAERVLNILREREDEEGGGR